MSINFPSNPSNGQVHIVSSSVLYTYIAAKDYWRFGNNNIPLELIPSNFDGGIHSLLFSSVWDLDKENDIHTFLLMGV